MLWVFVGILTVFVVVLLWYTPLVIYVKFSRISGDEEGKIVVQYLFGLIRIKRSLSAVNAHITPKGPQVSVKHGKEKTAHKHKIVTAYDVWGFLSHLREWIGIGKESLPIVRNFWKNVHVNDFQLQLSVGTGDTVSTGMAVGAMWGLTSYIIGTFSQYVRLEVNPQVEITPSYYQPMFQITFESIIKVRAGYAISAALRLFRVWKRRTSDGTPNSRSNADGHGKHSGNGRREHDYRRSG